VETTHKHSFAKKKRSVAVKNLYGYAEPRRTEMLQKEQRANTFAFFRIQQKSKKMTGVS